MTQSLDRFSAFVGRIYATVHDGTLWQDTLTDLADMTGSQGSVMHVFGPGGEISTIAMRFSLDSVDEFNREYAAICPRLAHVVKRPDIAVQYDRMVIADEDVATDPTYAFYARQGLRYYAGAAIAVGDKVRAAFSIQRSAAEGHVEHDDIRLMDLARAHMTQALAIGAWLGDVAGRPGWQSTSRTLQPHAIFVLDARGAVIDSNEAAHNLLSANDSIAVSGGKLATALQAEQKVFDRLILRALYLDLSQAPGWAWITRSSGRPRLAVTAMAIPLPERAHLMPEARAIVMVLDPARRPVADHAALRDLFGLTPAEIRVAELLVAGYDRPAAARVLGVSEQTLRTHGKAIFAKMGISRQVDLVRLGMLFGTFPE